MNEVNKEVLSELCQELRSLLEAELTAGNTVVETWKGWPKPESLFVLLASPFRITDGPLPPTVRYVAVDDPHYWKGEFVCDRTNQTLACRF